MDLWLAEVVNEGLEDSPRVWGKKPGARESPWYSFGN